MTVFGRVSIAGRAIGMDQPPFVVAELSGNHNGDLGRAKQTILAAKRAGADAVKLQTYRADTITLDHDGPGFMIDTGPWAGRNLHGLYDEAHTPWDWHQELFDYARSIGLIIFSSPFDFTSIDFLMRLGAPAYKIASFEIVDLPLIEKAASTGKPLIMSTGMATEAEIRDAVASAHAGGCNDIILLHCVSAYPAPVEDINLLTIPDLANRFGVVSGLSDHTLGSAVSVAATALGAAVIEKHVTLRRADGGPDASFSLEPDELAELVKNVHTAWRARGRCNYEVTSSERANLQFRRSLYIVQDVQRGELLTSDNVRSIRPGNGLAPKHYRSVLGRTAARDLKRGEPLDWSMVGP